MLSISSLNKNHKTNKLPQKTTNKSFFFLLLFVGFQDRCCMGERLWEGKRRKQGAGQRGWTADGEASVWKTPPREELQCWGRARLPLALALTPAAPQLSLALLRYPAQASP